VNFVRQRIACHIEPLPATEDVAPAFEVQALRVVVIEQVVSPADVTHVLARPFDMRVTAAVKLGLVARTAKRAVYPQH
jgi:hypothetical protein